MSVQICTADRYAVGMYGYDVCMHYMACGSAVVGKTLPGKMCEFLSNTYTSTNYDGTDPPTYYVAGNPSEKTGSASSALYTSLVPQIIMIALLLQLFGKQI
ncbi:Hypothetical predicted protein [Paramuricea clavata]|uniref:Uncharacterized protein n=1 Tax=Paramuricea clavata TaxID=317549 RepID=A0A6S7G3G3_PARCT|nr:Hypothetical predicted protein [Paramuricea clavata]